MTFSDRLLALATALGMGGPATVSDHARVRWRQRIDRRAGHDLAEQAMRALFDHAVIAHIDGRRRTTWWCAAGVTLVVSADGVVLTVFRDERAA